VELFNVLEEDRRRMFISHERSDSFPDKNNLMHFNITISPDEGFWKGRAFCCSFD